jgi:hypothetical protein
MGSCAGWPTCLSSSNRPEVVTVVWFGTKNDVMSASWSLSSCSSNQSSRSGWECLITLIPAVLCEAEGVEVTR